MKYKCNNCKKEFNVAATIMYQPRVNLPSTQAFPFPPTAIPYVNIINPASTPANPVIMFNYTVSQPCCPFCYSTDIEEIETK